MKEPEGKLVEKLEWELEKKFDKELEEMVEKKLEEEHDQFTGSIVAHKTQEVSFTFLQ